MNRTEYKDIAAFHPGYYIQETIEDMGITQEEFAKRMDTTAKTVSKLVNGQCGISLELAQKLAAMLGTGTDVWMNLQKQYEQEIAKIENQKRIDEQSKIAKMIDYLYFVRVAGLEDARPIQKKTENLCRYFRVADLRVLTQPDFLINYRTGISTVCEKNIVNARAWFQTAINFSEKCEVEKFDAKNLRQHLQEIRAMTRSEPNVFLPRLKQIFAECGVVFVLLPALKNSGINGAVKWINQDKVLLALNDRRCYADTFWFSLFHEIRHVFQQKTKTVFVSENVGKQNQLNRVLEEDADNFAQDYLIPPRDYKKWGPPSYVSDADICAFAEEIEIHPGIVVGRLQHDGIVSQSRGSHLKQKYVIVCDKD